MKTYDLKRSDREKKTAMDGLMEPMGDYDDYHHGLNFSLDDAAIKKMKLGEDGALPAKDSKHRISGAVTVTGMNDDRGGRRLQLLIHNLGMEPMEEDASTAAATPEKSIRDELMDARSSQQASRSSSGRVGRSMGNGSA